MNSHVPPQASNLHDYLAHVQESTPDIRTLAVITTTSVVIAATTSYPDQIAALAATGMLLPLAQDLIAAFKKSPCSYLILGVTTGYVILIPITDTVGLVAVTTTLKLGMLLTDLIYVTRRVVPFLEQGS